MSKNQITLNVSLPSDNIIDKEIVDEIRARVKNIVRDEFNEEILNVMESEVERLIKGSPSFSSWRERIKQYIHEMIESKIKSAVRSLDIRDMVRDEVRKYCEIQTVFEASDLKKKCENEITNIVSQTVTERIRNIISGIETPKNE